MKKAIKIIIATLCIAALTACLFEVGNDVPPINEHMELVPPTEPTPQLPELPTEPPLTVTSEVMALKAADYAGEVSVEVNGNSPFLTQVDMTTNAFETYSELDGLGRCGVCYANVGPETMPTEERGEIGMVKPTGWHTIRYDDLVDGKYLYNRCHLIGYQLTGENANPRNLITGTRYLNVQGMLPYENEVATYVQTTGNHVLYRVTPIFEGNDLVAQGVLMEAYSVEDQGDGVQFCVFCYNVQPGVIIDYATGESELDPAYEPPTDTPILGEATYILNTKTKKFHSTGCPAAGQIKDHNKAETDKNRAALISEGYAPCGACKP